MIFGDNCLIDDISALVIPYALLTSHNISKSPVKNPQGLDVIPRVNYIRGVTKDKGPANMEKKKKCSSTCHRVHLFLPLIKPSYVSLILVFVCAFLWVKNEEEYKDLFALEDQLTKLKEQCLQHTSPQELDGRRPESQGKSFKFFHLLFLRAKRSSRSSNLLHPGFP